MADRLAAASILAVIIEPATGSRLIASTSASAVVSPPAWRFMSTKMRLPTTETVGPLVSPWSLSVSTTSMPFCCSHSWFAVNSTTTWPSVPKSDRVDATSNS